jgi:hypothetical protein
MSMGIVSDDEFDSELNKFAQRGTVKDLVRGRGNGNNAVPESLRKLIGENAIEEGSKETKVLTRALGISDSSLSAYKAGAASTSSYHNPSFIDHIDKARERVVKKARNRLVFSLDAITKEKLANEKPRDLAGIAKDMSVVIRNMEPSQEGPNQPRNQLVIFAPQLVTEGKFDVIEVKE